LQAVAKRPAALKIRCVTGRNDGNFRQNSPHGEKVQKNRIGGY
jgi:hypothetical protein